jgi:response regulator of citrate/malate metabolism
VYLAPPDAWLKEFLIPQLHRLETKLDAVSEDLHGLREEVRRAQFTADAARQKVDKHIKDAEPLMTIGSSTLSHISQWVDEETARRIWIRTAKSLAAGVTAVAATVAALYSAWQWLRGHP